MKKNTKSKMSKAAFVRSMGNAPAKDVVAKAKAQKIGTISEEYVYNVRTTSKKKAGGKARLGIGGHEVLLAAAAEVGYGNAIKIIQEARR
jgi:hypothetical protein